MQIEPIGSAADPDVDTILSHPAPLKPGGRVTSVDALRGLTILLMIFVNDLGAAAPSWLHHIQPYSADGMTVADVVFPMFLFIVGVSIPLAIEHAKSMGRSNATIVAHILLRTTGLLVMGLIQLNGDEDRTLGGRAWSTLAFASILLAWCAIPGIGSPRRKLWIYARGIGIAGLLLLLIIYRRGPQSTAILFRGPVEGWAWMKTEWWGILGLIGWAYLTAALLTLILGKRREWLMGALAMLMSLHLAMEEGGLFKHVGSKPWLGGLRPFVDSLAGVVNWAGSYVGLGGATGSLAGIAMAGCLLGSILGRESEIVLPRARISWALTFAIGLGIAGLFTDTFEGINKVGATLTWCLWCSAIACVLWIGLYLAIDVAGFVRWSYLLRSTGANPLVAYFLHPIVINVVVIAGLAPSLLAYKYSANPWVVVAGSMAMAVAISALAGGLGRLGLRPKL